MDPQLSYNLFDRRPIVKSKTPAVKWVKEWVPQDAVATGGKCYLMKWITEDALKVLKEKNSKEPVVPEPEPEPTTEVLFLCSYDGCGKTFIDAGHLRKHSNIHGERQHTCDYEGCGKKFLDSSKLKRHWLIHTGERNFICPVEGCGKAFSLDFNLRSHMKTHSQENYHICPYPECGKRYAHEYKLKNHIASQHEKNSAEPVKYTPPVERPVKTPRPPSVTYGPTSSDRPYACPYEGCPKAYIHEYKLNLHLRREHPGHYSEENPKSSHPHNVDNDLDDASDQDAYAMRVTPNNLKPKKRKSDLKLSSAKIMRKGSSASPGDLNMIKKSWPIKEEIYQGDDSEETEEDRDNGEDGWRFGENNDDDDEETEYED